MSSRPSLSLLAIAATALPLAAQEDFCQSPLGVSHLLTPGTATCEVMGQSTTVTLFDNTVLSWDTITLRPTQRLEFAFVNPAHTVVNQSRGTAVAPVIGTRPTLIGGTLVSNGNVVILSPNNWLQFTDEARVEVGSFTASGLGGASEQFFSNSGEIELSATERTNPTTLIRGNIHTTRGDLVVVGKELEITAKIDSAGSVTAVTGTSVRLNRSGRRVSSASGGTQIITGSSIKARDQIEFVSQQALSMVGELTPGNGRGTFYAKVDENGEIKIGQAGLTIQGSGVFSSTPTGEIAFINLDDNNPGTRSPAVNEFPVFGAKRTTSRTRPTGSSITARAPSSFSKPKPATSPKKRTKASSTAVTSSALPTLRTRRWFGTRTVVTKKKER